MNVALKTRTAPRYFESIVKKYARDLNDQDLLDKNMFGVALETFKDGGYGGGSKTSFKLENDKIFPHKSYAWDSGFPNPQNGGAWYLTAEVLQHNSEGFPEEIEYRNGLTTYLAWNNGLLEEEQVLSRKKKYTYWPNRQIKSITDVDGQTVNYEYDDLQRLDNIQARSGIWNTDILHKYAPSDGINAIDKNVTIQNANYARDSYTTFTGKGIKNGNYTRAYSVNGNDFGTTVNLDPLDRVTSECSDGQGSCLEYTYRPDPLSYYQSAQYVGWPKGMSFDYTAARELYGRITTDEDERVHESHTDALGRELIKVRPDGTEITTGYDARGQVVGVSGPAGDYGYTYDGKGRMVSKEVPDGGEYTYTYYNTDLLHTQTDPNGTVFSHTYTEYNELDQIFSNDNLVKDYEYYQSGQGKTGKIKSLVTATSDGGTATYTYDYDVYGRLITEDLSGPGGGYAIANVEIDNADYVKISTIDGIRTENEYDHGGRLISTKLGHNQSGGAGTYDPKLVGSYKYNDQDWKIQHALGGDLENALQQMDYAYNDRGWLTQINDLENMKSAFEDGFNFDPGVLSEDDLWTINTNVQVDYNLTELLSCAPTSILTTIDGTVTVLTGDYAGTYPFAHEIPLLLNGQEYLPSNPSYDKQAQFSFAGDNGTELLAVGMKTELESSSTSQVTCDKVARTEWNQSVTKPHFLKQLKINGVNILNRFYSLDTEELLIESYVTNYLSQNGGGVFTITPVSFGDYGEYVFQFNNIKADMQPDYVLVRNCDDITNCSVILSDPDLNYKGHFINNTQNADCACETLSDYNVGLGPNYIDLDIVRNIYLGGSIAITRPNGYDMENPTAREDLISDIEAYLDAEGLVYSEVLIDRNVLSIKDTDADFNRVRFHKQNTSPTGLYYKHFGRKLKCNACYSDPSWVINEYVDIIGDIPTDILYPIQKNCDMFAEKIIYHDVEDEVGASSYYAGNISYNQVMVADNPHVETYVYDYDPIDQVMSAKHWQEYLYSAQYGIWKWRNPNTYNTSYSYDAGGNIQTINRSGLTKRQGNGVLEFGAMDDLKFTYGDIANRVTDIQEMDNSPDFIEHGFKSTGGGIEYDNNGNITKYGPDQIDEIQYDIFNYPKRITFADNRKVELIYDTEGFKHKMVFKDKNNIEQKTYTYGSNRLSIVDHIAGTSEEYYNFDGGRYRYTSEEDKWSYEYVLRDHLGNGRVWVKDLNEDGYIACDPGVDDNPSEITQIEHYYPFGMSWDGAWKGQYAISDQIDNDHRYNGKQDFNSDGLEWMDYGFRWYDPSVGRFMGSDPIAELFPHVSPYNYAENKPVNGIDLWGLQHYRPGPEQEEFNGEMGRKFVAFVKSWFIEGKAEGNYNEEVTSDAKQGITILSSSEKNSAGSNPAQDGQGSTGVIETDELLTPGGGITGKATKNAGRAQNIIHKAAKVGSTVDRIIENESDSDSSSNEPADSICNTCKRPPHWDFPYRRVNENGEPIDTIVPEERINDNP